MFPSTYQLPQFVPYGVRSLKTQLGVRVLTINYRADPAKRGKDYQAGGEARRGYSRRKWLQEMENDWSITAGKPVYPEFDKTRHESSEIFKAMQGQPVYVGWDFGLFPAAVFCQPTDAGQVRILRVLNEEQCGLNRFAPLVLQTMLALNAEAGYGGWDWARLLARQQALLALLRIDAGEELSLAKLGELDRQAWRSAVQEAFEGGLDFIHAGDPAGKNRQANDAQGGFKYLLSHFGLRLSGNQKDQGRDRRIGAVTALLDAPDVAPGVSAFSISLHPSTERLRMGFEGAYKFSENVETGGKAEPVKDKFSHPQDAFQYAACHMFPATSSKPIGAAVMVNYSPDAAAKPLTQPETRWDGLELDEAVETPPEKVRSGPVFAVKRTQAVAAAPAWNPFIQSQVGGG